MSERERQFESGKLPEIDKKEFEKINELAAEKRREAAERAANKEPDIEKLIESLEHTALSSKEIQDRASKQENNASESILNVGSGVVKNIHYKQRVKEIQRSETPAQRRLSKVIHQPAVEAFSNAAEGTIARPSGLLFAGIFSFISSLAVLIICRRYGYEYNFSIGLACLGCGFLIGLILEAFYRIVKRPNKQK